MILKGLRAWGLLILKGLRACNLLKKVLEAEGLLVLGNFLEV